MSEPRATVIADSLSPEGARLTTIEVTCHRFVLAELNTHRAFSRNSASSRAIPVYKQVDKVNADTAYPMVWPLEQPGMQGGDNLSPETELTARDIWDDARRAAVQAAGLLAALGLHKSVTNRLLEPFMWHTVIVSATTDGYDNFWVQRCSPLAQPEIRVAAEEMKAAYDASEPLLLGFREWHLPYVDQYEFDDIETAKQVSVARCARVSTLNHDGKRDVDADLKLYDRLVSATPPHASPLEHVAISCVGHEAAKHLGNFKGFDQLRHLVLAP